MPRSWAAISSGGSRSILPVIGHVQIAAVPSRHEPDEGEVSYPGIFAALDRLGYAGLDRLRIQSAGEDAGRARLGTAIRGYFSRRIEPGNRRRHWRGRRRLLVYIHVGT